MERIYLLCPCVASLLLPLPVFHKSDSSARALEQLRDQRAEKVGSICCPPQKMPCRIALENVCPSATAIGETIYVSEFGQFSVQVTAGATNRFLFELINFNVVLLNFPLCFQALPNGEL